MVPTKQRLLQIAACTAGMLIFNHNNFIAEKHGDIGRPANENKIIIKQIQNRFDIVIIITISKTQKMRYSY